MEHSIASPNFRNQVLKFGILIAIVNIIITLLIYVIDLTLMVKWWFALIILAINIALILYAGFEWRKENGGYLTFKNAFVFTFLVLVLAGLIGLLFRLLLFNVVDPNLQETLTEATIEETTVMMEKMGAQDDQIDRVLEDTRENVSTQFSVAGILRGFLWSLVFYVIGALIIGAIVKKKRPEYEG